MSIRDINIPTCWIFIISQICIREMINYGPCLIKLCPHHHAKWVDNIFYFLWYLFLSFYAILCFRVFLLCIQNFTTNTIIVDCIGKFFIFKMTQYEPKGKIILTKLPIPHSSKKNRFFSIFPGTCCNQRGNKLVFFPYLILFIPVLTTLVVLFKFVFVGAFLLLLLYSLFPTFFYCDSFFVIFFLKNDFFCLKLIERKLPLNRHGFIAVGLVLFPF